MMSSTISTRIRIRRGSPLSPSRQRRHPSEQAAGDSGDPSPKQAAPKQVLTGGVLIEKEEEERRDRAREQSQHHAFFRRFRAGSAFTLRVFAAHFFAIRGWFA
jgi:hypothetical protein